MDIKGSQEQQAVELRHQWNPTFLSPLNFEEVPPLHNFPGHTSDWVAYELIDKCGPNGVDFENRLYGPLNGILGAYFPFRRRYEIKPQYRIDPVWKPSSGGHARADSYDSKVSTKGNYGVPDFVIDKCAFAPGFNTPFRHHMVAIVEVKKEEQSVDRAFAQIARYLETAVERTNRHNPLVGILTLGDKVAIMLATKAQNDVHIHKVGTFFMKEQRLWTLLYGLTRTYWNWPLRPEAAQVHQ